MLSFIKPELEQEGIELDIQEFSDWTQLNPSLAGKELDANYFQHVPYLETYNEGAGTDLVPIAKVHVEPLGVYSKRLPASTTYRKSGSSYPQRCYQLRASAAATAEGRPSYLKRRSGGAHSHAPPGHCRQPPQAATNQ